MELCRLLLDRDEAARPSAEEALQRFSSWLREATGEERSNVWRWGAVPKCEEQVRDTMRKLTVKPLSSLQHRSHLDRCVMACVATQLNATKLRYLNETFESWDRNGSGVLDLQEMSEALADMGVRGGDVDTMLKLLDTDGDGHVNYSEFVAGCLDLQREQVVQHLRVAFSIFDLDSSGFIDREELDRMLRPCLEGQASEEEGSTVSKGDDPASSELLRGLLPDGATLDEMLEELDSSRDGHISFEEFQAYLLRNITEHS